MYHRLDSDFFTFPKIHFWRPFSSLKQHMYYYPFLCVLMFCKNIILFGFMRYGPEVSRENRGFSFLEVDESWKTFQ